MAQRDRSGSRSATVAAKAGHYMDVHSGAITPSLEPSTTFARDDRYDLLNPANGYSRADNPTYVHAERTIAELENAESCLLFCSGMAAISTLFSTLNTGSHVVLPDSMYWGAMNWIERYCKRMDIFVSYFDPSDAGTIGAALENHSRSDLVWLETPSNPMLHVTDISHAAELAHAAGAMLCVDSTAATPVFTRPLDLGADLVMHSATKYLNGHSDALAGAIAGSEDCRLWEDLQHERQGAGTGPGTLEAWLLLRGMRTLYVRVEKAAASAMQIAEYLQQHNRVTEVLYPGLSTHPAHQLASQQMQDGYGALLSFLVDGDAGVAKAVAGRLQTIISATSLGGVETLIEHRATIEPDSTGIPQNLLRLSVGIESVDDLIDDLEQALVQAD